MPRWWAPGRAAGHSRMSSLCSWCGQGSSSSLAAPVPQSSTCWLACSSPHLLSAPYGATHCCRSWLPDLPVLLQHLSGQVPCHPSGLSAPQRVRGTRQPRSIFRPWRIPLGSPFRAEKVSHCEGEAKTRIRPTDPALTRTPLRAGRTAAFRSAGGGCRCTRGGSQRNSIQE